MHTAPGQPASDAPAERRAARFAPCQHPNTEQRARPPYARAGTLKRRMPLPPIKHLYSANKSGPNTS
jgi:hypothetical protein